MATARGRGLSERPAKTLLRMIQKVGEEQVVYPPEGEGGAPMSQREALARALWKRALRDGDLACAKFLMECLDGKGDARGGAKPVDAAELRAAEQLLAAWWAEKDATSSPGPRVSGEEREG